MMLRKKISGWLRDKLGVTETRLEFDKQLQYLNSYLQLVTPEEISFGPEVNSYVLERAQKEFGIDHFDTTVHKNDLMFHHQLRRFPDASAEAVYKYFRVGILAARKISELLRDEPGVYSLLDFGSGYGRCSRFYPLYFPAAEVYVSEIKNHALRYQQDRFGFKTLLHGSEAQPVGSIDFDLIVAISVFTHLPEDLGRAWLRQLYKQLKPGGKLLFTYVDITLAPAPDADSYYFSHHSEDAGMSWVGDRITDAAVYGSTFYGEKKMQALIEAETGGKAELLKAFLGKHDLAVVSKPSLG